jgi:hypothetical protein
MPAASWCCFLLLLAMGNGCERAVCACWEGGRPRSVSVSV